jgi:hypothetical protein
VVAVRTGGTRHVIVVQPMKKSLDEHGHKELEANGAPVPVSCDVFPLSAEDIATFGTANEDIRSATIRDRPWPGDQSSVLTFDGSIWEQVGPAVSRDIGLLTKRTVVKLKRLGKADG